ncbi:MAG: hypothetical protein ACFBSF_04345 [Leptolyngbyaceae cyanobacterium]
MKQLAIRIEAELGDILIAVDRAVQGWQKFTRSGDELYIDSIALNLQSVYTGLESLFEEIAKHIDGSRLDGEGWHKQLLQQVAPENAPIRPAVISSRSLQYLDEWRRFRHLVRHNYATKLDAAKVEILVDNLNDQFRQISAELIAFAKFLHQQSEG